MELAARAERWDARRMLRASDGQSEVIHLDEKRAFRRSDPFGVPIRGHSSQIVGNPEVMTCSVISSEGPLT